MKVVITNVPSGKFEIGPRSTSFVSTPSPMNEGSTAKPSDGSDDAGADEAAEADRGEREEARPAVRLEVLVLRGGEARRRRVAHELVRRRRVDGRVRARGVADPEQAEDEREQRRRRSSAGDADDEADEDDGDADGEADRPEALARRLRSVVRILGHSLLSIA